MALQPLPQQSPNIQVPVNIDYTSRDYTGMVNSLLIFASQVFPDWTASSEGDIGVMFLELFSYVGDILSYYTDRVATEAYLPTATQRQSLLNIAQLLGYVPGNGTPATGTVTFITDNPGLAVVIPAGTVVQSNFNNALDAPVSYYTTSLATCPANGGTITVPVSQGTQYVQVPIGTSTGLPGQTLQIPQLEVLDGSVSIFVQSSAASGNTQWQQVSTFINAGASDTSFTLEVDAHDTTNITFGDGVNGLIPALGLQIFASYTTIVGSDGNCGAGAVSIMAQQITGLTIQSVSNVAQSSIMAGGSDPESNDSIRANAPIAFATQKRAVSISDYASLALNIPGVVSANAVANHSTSVSLYVLGPNVTVPSSQLKAQILATFADSVLAGVTLTLPTPNLIAVDVGSTTNYCTLQVGPTFSQQATVNAVVLALNNVLTPPATNFGQMLNVSSLYLAVMAVTGVEYVILPVMTREDILQNNANAIQFRQNEIPIAGNYFILANGGL